MDTLSTIAQSLDSKGYAEAGALVRRLAVEKSQICAALSNPDLVAYIAGQLQGAGMPGAAQLAVVAAQVGAGACAVLGASPAPQLAQAKQQQGGAMGIFTAATAGGNGGGNAGGCGCGGSGTPGGTPGTPGGGNLPAPAPGACPVNPPAPPTYVPSTACPNPGGPIPVCQDIGRWNCLQVRSDLAPCDVSKIKREEKLETFADTAAGPIAAGSTIDVIFQAVGVSHDLCIEYLLVENVTAGVGASVAISEITLQGERIAETGNGNYEHVWDYPDPERPDYLGITDGRCACKFLCVCIPAEARAKMSFTLPTAIAGGDTLRITVWGRRQNWEKLCGPCPPCMQCDMEALSPAELALTADDMLVTEP